MGFKDHFSTVSENYQHFRPVYPDELFYHLSFLCKQHNCAWDCGTGTGQSARNLALYFNQVIATDASAEQISQAAQNPRSGLEFKVAPAELSGLDKQSLDLITVSQAIHWFNLQAFTHEIQRVLKPGGILAIWCYTFLHIADDIDALLNHFYHHVVGPYWPFERSLIENGYRDIQFPFTELEVPEYKMAASWNLSQLLGYLSTWSAVRRYQTETGEDPLIELKQQLARHWGDALQIKTIHWPLCLRIWSRH